MCERQQRGSLAAGEQVGLVREIPQCSPFDLAAGQRGAERERDSHGDEDGQRRCEEQSPTQRTGKPHAGHHGTNL